MPSRFSKAFIQLSVVSLSLLGAATSASAACTINVFVQNEGKYRIWVRNEMQGPDGTGVRQPLVGWSALQRGGWQPAGIPDQTGGPYFGVKAGTRIGDGYDTPRSCNVRRRYRVEYICDGGPSKGSRFVKYYPSIDSWTPQVGVDNVTVPLGSKCN